MGKGSLCLCVLICSHLPIRPRWFFSSRPPIREPLEPFTLLSLFPKSLRTASPVQLCPSPSTHRHHLDEAYQHGGFSSSALVFLVQHRYLAVSIHSSFPVQLRSILMAAQAHHQSPPMPMHHGVGAPPPPPPPGPGQWAPSRQILAMNEAVWVQIGTFSIRGRRLGRNSPAHAGTNPMRRA